MRFTPEDHTFVICAYKESAFLEACIQSLLNQETLSRILITTATPNGHIDALAERYRIPVRVNPDPPNIATDFEFGIRQAKTPLVTLCHQDDRYHPEYLRTALEYLNRARRPLIFFTGYQEQRGALLTGDNTLLRIKRLMLLPLRGGLFRSSRFVRRRVLSFGCPICCPSVTFAVENLELPVFQPGYRCNVDWQAWERISRRKGQFLYCPRPLMAHRIHEDSETSAGIREQARTQEDDEMFRKFWPAFIAGLLMRFYAKSQASNQIETVE